MELHSFATQLDNQLAHLDGGGRVIYGAQNEALRLSQQEALEALSDHVVAGNKEGYMVLPGGAGKTRIEIFSADAAKKAGTSTLIIVPSQLAVEGTYKQFRQTAPHLKVNRLYADVKELDADCDVLVTTYASLIDYLNGKETDGKKLDPAKFGLVFADEGHRYLTELADDTLQKLDHAVQIALTATPRYYEGKEVANQFGDKIFELSLAEAIKRGEITPLKNRLIETHIDLGLDRLRAPLRPDQEYNGELERAVNNVPWNHTFADVYKKYEDPETGDRLFGHKTFVFCAGVQHAKDMADRFNQELGALLQDDEFRTILRAKGINPDNVKQIAAPVWGEMDIDEKRRIIERYENGEILVLTSSDLLRESVDSPATRAVMNATPTMSYVVAGQRAMRGSRIFEGKDDWYVFDALPQGWQKSGIIPVLFAEFAQSILEEMEGKKVSIEGDRKRRGIIGEQDPGYNIIWEAKDLLDIVRDNINRRTANLLLPPAPQGYISAVGLNASLANQGYVSSLARIRKLYDGFESQIRGSGMALTEPYHTQEGINTLLGFSARGGNIPHAEAEKVIPYVIDRFNLQKVERLSLPPDDFVSLEQTVGLVRDQGYEFSRKTGRKSFDELERKYDAHQQTLAAEERNKTPVAIDGIRTIKAWCGRGNILYAHKDDIVPYIVQKYKPKQREERYSTPPPGYISERVITRDMAGFVGYSKALRELLADIETQYHTAQEALPEEAQYKEPITSTQGIRAIFAGSPSKGGNQIYVRREDIWKHIAEHIKPEKILPPAPEDFVSLDEGIRAFHIPTKKQAELEALKGALDTEYTAHQAQLAEDQRHKLPHKTSHSVEVIKAGKSNANIIFAKKDQLEKYLKETVGLIKKLPDPPDGFVTASKVADSLQDEGYIVNKADVSRLYAAFEPEYDQHQATVPEAQRHIKPFVTSAAIPIIRAASNRGNIIHAQSDKIRAYVLEQLDLKKPTEERLPPPPAGYIFEAPALSLLRESYILGNADQIKTLAAEYDTAQAALPEDQRHKEPFTTQSGIRLIKAGNNLGNFIAINPDDLVDKLPKVFGLEKRLSECPSGYCAATQALKLLQAGHGTDTVQKTLLAVLQSDYDAAQATLPEDQRHKEPYRTEDSIRVIKAFSGTANRYYFNEDDLRNHAHVAMGTEKRLSPPPTGFPSRDEVSRELKVQGYDASPFVTKKSYDKLEREYDEHQQTLPEDDRHKEPFTTHSGVRVIKAHRAGQNLLYAAAPEIYDFLVNDLGLEKSHVVQQEARREGNGSAQTDILEQGEKAPIDHAEEAINGRSKTNRRG